MGEVGQDGDQNGEQRGGGHGEVRDAGEGGEGVGHLEFSSADVAGAGWRPDKDGICTLLHDYSLRLSHDVEFTR